MQFKKYSKLIQSNNCKTYLNQAPLETLSLFFNSELCKQVFDDYRWDFRFDTLYNPLTTLMLFIKQVLSPDKSCRKAVSGLIANELLEHDNLVGSNTGPFVKARQRLPEEAIHRLVTKVAMDNLEIAPIQWNPYGRSIKIFDGTTVSMPDTNANKSMFPKHSNQKKAVGFPLARIVGVISLATGSVIDYAIGPCKGKGTGEISLLRSILGAIKENDIALGDRLYCNFF